MNKSVIPASLILIILLPCYLISAAGFWPGKFNEGQAIKLDAPPTAAQTAVPGIQLSVEEVLVSGLTRPLQVTHAGDGSHRLFVVEQEGVIRVVKNGQVLPVPFLDLSRLASCCGELGLLGLAFHPNYERNGYFYVNYTRKEDWVTVIARYTVSKNADKADPTSALTLLTVAQPYNTHKGGQLTFSPLDGYLYVGMGDGGPQGDPDNRAQDKNILLGKILRLDVDGDLPYAVPPDNPYVGRAGADEIWAIGLRNPWRFSFDRATGDLYIGDVGQDTWEEINYQAARTPGGVNFGWRCEEGTHPYNFVGDCVSATITDPIAEYDHSLGIAVIGGFVYRGLHYPALVGTYFFADFGSGRIWSLRKTGPAPWSAPQQVLDTDFNISAFGEDEAGELYIVEYTAEPGHAKIRRLAALNTPSLTHSPLK